MSTMRMVFIVAVVALLSGCASWNILSMPDSMPDYAVVRTFFATDRNLTGKTKPDEMFGVETNNDFHIPIAPHPDDSEIHAIVVEMIPQERPKGWTEQKLRDIARKRLPVAVRGQLFYDNKHLVNSDPDDIKPGQPKRFSLWELHPVIEFHVCIRAEKKCDPKDITQWEPLEKVEN